MVPFTAEDFILAREMGQGKDAVDRALTLLVRAEPGASVETLLRLPLGRRNAQLLVLRERLFGPQLAAYAECPTCGQAVEFVVDARELRSAGAQEAPPPEVEFEVDGYTVRFRLLDSNDLKAAVSSQDVATARAALVRRSVLGVCTNGQPVAPADMPEPIVEQLGERLQEADPQAEMLIDLVCPACDRGWQLAFDIASFLYAEVDAHARRLLREVHALARGYGWREADILAMSSRRRREYLEMLLP